MRIAYLDCFAGISGNMVLGALLDAGLSLERLEAELARLGLDGYRIVAGEVRRKGLRGIHVEVETEEQGVARHLHDIEEIIEGSGLPAPVQARSLSIFRRLAEAEARVHGTPVDHVHFHEVGALDAIVDVVGAVTGFWLLGVERAYASHVHVGRGTITCAHGVIPVPAPATAELLKGVPIYGRDVEAELVTPTGAAILASLAAGFGPGPAMRVDQIGYGAGTRELPLPNLLRISIGETLGGAEDGEEAAEAGHGGHGHHDHHGHEHGGHGHGEHGHGEHGHAAHEHGGHDHAGHEHAGHEHGAHGHQEDTAGVDPGEEAPYAGEAAQGPAAGEKPKDRDFLQTREGMLFCVTGYLHPPDRYTAYLKYTPDPGGKWRDGERAYRRELAHYHVSTVAGTLRYLEANYPHYVSDCPVRDIRFSMVPRDCVARYFRPRERLQEILAGPRDALEEETCALVDYIAGLAGLSAHDMGVTGSLLTATHNPDFSDIDLLVYGRAEAALLRDRLGPEGTDEFRRPSAEERAGWCARVAEHHPLSVDEAAYLARRRWNYGYFGPRYVSIHAIRRDEEIDEEYGQRTYRARGLARLRAVLADVSEALFLPAIYRVEGVEVLEGDAEAAGVRAIVSHEGLYCDVAEPGATVEAYGKLEAVNGRVDHLVVGAMEGAGGYIKPPLGTGG